MIRKILITCSMALISLAFSTNILAAAILQPEELPPPPNLDGWYVAGYWGFSFPSTIRFTDTSGQVNRESFDDGYDTGARFGYKSGPIRYEGEFIYMQSDVKNFTTSDLTDITVPASGKVKLYSGMINVLYDFEGGPIPCLTPYIGGGFGYAYINNQIDTPSFSDHLSSQRDLYAGQAIGGFSVRLGQHFGLFTEYRYFITQDAKATVQLIPGGEATGRKHFQSHTINFGGTFYLG